MVLLSVVPVHKFYLSLTEIRYNQNNGHLEIASKIFIDDLESVVEGLKIDDEADEASSALIGKYLIPKTSIVVNGEKVDLNYLGYEIDQDVVWCYLESDSTGLPNKVELQLNMLLDEIETQTNLVNFDFNKEVQTLFLKDDQRNGSIIFEK